jgi:hypothetical protein
MKRELVELFNQLSEQSKNLQEILISLKSFKRNYSGNFEKDYKEIAPSYPGVFDSVKVSKLDWQDFKKHVRH